MRPAGMDRRHLAIGLAVALLIGVALYFAGRWQERSRAEAIHEELTTRTVAAVAQRDRALAELAVAETQIKLLRARSLLFETALDLERRNFGTANTRLAAAAEQLAAVSAGSTGAGREGVEKLRGAIASTDLRVAADLAGQRARVLGFAEELDRLIPRR